MCTRLAAATWLLVAAVLPPTSAATAAPHSPPAGDEPASRWRDLTQLTSEAQVVDALAQELRRFPELGDNASSRALVAQWRREIGQERLFENERFLRLSFDIRQHHATRLAEQKTRALAILRLRERIAEIGARLDAMTADEARHRQARDEVARTRREAERGFPVVYSNLHSFFVTGAVAWCDGKASRVASEEMATVMRQAASELVHAIGSEAYVREAANLASRASSDPSRNDRAFLQRIRIDQSLSIFPLGEPVDAFFKLEAADSPELVGGVRLLVYPVSTQPRVASEATAAPLEGTGAPAGRAVPRGCAVHPFLLARPDTRFIDPCVGAAEGPAAPLGRLPDRLCAEARLQELLATARQPDSRLGQMLASVETHQRGSRRDEWQRAVADYSRQIDDLQQLEGDRSRRLDDLATEREGLLRERELLRAQLAAACQTSRLDQAAATDGAESELLADFPVRRVILVVPGAFAIGDGDATLAEARSLLEAARGQAGATHRDWLREVLRDEASSRYLFREGRSTTVPQLPSRLRVIDQSLDDGRTSAIQRHIEVAFEFALPVHRELLLPWDDPPRTEARAPGLYRFDRSGRAYLLLPGDPVSYRRAEEAVARANASRSGGVDTWHLVRSGDVRALRAICHGQPDGAPPPEGCTCAWTDTEVDDPQSHALGSRLFEIVRPSTTEGLSRYFEDTVCGVVLTSGAGEVDQLDPCPESL